MPKRGTPSFFSEEAKVKISNAVVAMKYFKAHATRNNITTIANSIHKGTTTPNIFNKESVSAGWHQSWISRMIAKSIIKKSSGTTTYDVTQETRCTSYNLEAYYNLHVSEMAKAGIYEYNNSYDETVDKSEEFIFSHPSHIIC